MTLALRRWAQKAARAGRAVRDKFPLTWLGTGLAVTAALATAGWGVRRQDMVFLVVGYGVLALEALAIAMVLLTAIGLRLAVRIPEAASERLLAGVETATQFSLPALGFLPLVSLRWEWLEPAAVSVEAKLERGRLVEHVVFRERGAHPRAVRRIIVEDVLGFARIAFRLVESNERMVLPGCPTPLSLPLRQMLGQGDALSHPAGRPEGDPIEMRRYGPGDPVKRILWKVYARTRTLMVRVPEKALSPIPRTLTYLVAGEEDEAAASLARATLEARLLGPDWRFGADGSESVTHSPAEALAMIVRSRAAREEGGAGLGRFLRSSESGSNLLLFAPATKGPWVEAVERALAKHRVSAQIVLVAEYIEAPLARNARAWRWLVSKSALPGPSLVGTPAHDVDALAGRLRSAGARVCLVERATGRLYTPQPERRAA